ncbi:MAG TPA: CDP-alcohol phosphatidyltransferase family protein [Methylomirabilota bacterium]|nr:CDP-alcohol phosphatidyltransferase family protein [Methylomirabilota bacterium]
MLSHYKTRIGDLADPLARTLLRWRVRPNQLTLFGLFASVGTAIALARGRLRLAALFLVLAGLLDILDGSLARCSDRVTPFGGFLDSVIDRYSDLAVLVGLLVYFLRLEAFDGIGLTLATLVGTIMVSYSRAKAESIGATCEVGLMERGERIIVLIIGALFHLLIPALWLLAILTNLTALQRIYHTWRITKFGDRGPGFGAR